MQDTKVEVIEVTQPAATITPSQPSLSMAEVVSLVRACSTEICGEDLDETAHFAEHHFDSLAAVELATSISKAVGVTLPSMCSSPFIHATMMKLFGP